MSIKKMHFFLNEKPFFKVKVVLKEKAFFLKRRLFFLKKRLFSRKGNFFLKENYHPPPPQLKNIQIKVVIK